ILIFVLAGIVIDTSVREMDGRLDELVNTDQPINEAATEMELSAYDISRNVRSYVLDPDPGYRRQFDRARTEFERQEARYARLAGEEYGVSVKGELDRLFERYAATGESLMDIQDGQAAALARADEAFTELEAAADYGVLREDPEKTLLLAAIETNSAETAAALRSYLVSPEQEYRDLFFEKAREVEESLDRFRELDLTGREREYADRVEQSLARSVEAGEEAISLRIAAREGLKLFSGQRNRLIGLLDEEIRAETRRNLDETENVVAEKAGDVYRTIVLMILVGLVVGTGSSLAIGGGIVRSLRGLREGAERIGRGELDYRIDGVGDDELGAVAASFNQMAERRQRAEEKLKESERRFATLLSNAPAVVYRTKNEPGWPMEFISDHVRELTGYPAREFIRGGLRYGDLIVPEDRQRVWDEVQDAISDRERFRIEYSIRRADGRIRHVEEFGQSLFGESGEVVAIEGLVTDITARREAERRMRDAEARYRALVEQVPIVVYTGVLGDDDAAYISPRIEDLVGYTAKEWLHDPKLWERLLHPEDREHILAEDRRVEETGEPFRAEYRMISRDGRVVWVYDEAVPIRDASGETRFWQGVMIDITERKRAEKALSASERRFRQLFDQSVEIILVHDERGRILDCNAEAARAHGYTREEMLRLSISDLTDSLLSEEERRARQREGGTLWQRIVAGDASAIGAVHEGVHRRRDGTTFPVEARIGGVDYDGKRRILASIRDVTERKEAEERLRVSEAELRAVLSSMKDLILVLDREGRYLKIVTSDPSLLYRQGEDRTGKTVRDIL
ncbi:MAG: PAS domain S-box protein, partial [Actinomycetota bacterium]